MEEGKFWSALHQRSSSNQRENNLYLDNNNELQTLMEVFSREIINNKPKDIPAYLVTYIT